MRGALQVREIHRFANVPIRLPSGLHWDVIGLFREIVVGLQLARRAGGDLASIGVDSWAVDFGFLDADGMLLGAPYHHRDGRGSNAVASVHSAVPRERLYERTGIQFLPFNTIYQLAAARDTAQIRAAALMVLIPDLMAYWLTGQILAERTNASTTGLLDVRKRTWALDVMSALSLSPSLLPPLRESGDVVGPMQPHAMEATGLSQRTVLTLVGSHDTASAVVAVPARSDRFAYISCGTWSLVGVELRAPILSDASRIANFSNELGVDGRVRYLRNVMGLWLLQESQRVWESRGQPIDLRHLLSAAESLPDGGPMIDVDDPGLVAPGDIPGRLGALCRRTGRQELRTMAQTVRCILDSLAFAYARTIGDAERLIDKPIEVVHIVGGGSRITLLCQLTADACGLPVIAGPAEATVTGNILVQARSMGHFEGDLDRMRELVRESQDIRRFEPGSRQALL